MTITSQTNVVTAQGNGVTTTFSYNFLMPDASDAVIIFTNAAGSQTTLTPTQYTITGIGNSAGGTVTYPIGGPSPIASGTTLTIARILPLVQETSISNQGAFYPQAIESALDYEMMVSQQIENTAQHALVTPIVDPAVPLPLPAAAQRANQLLGFDGAGNPIAAQPSSALVSTVMQPVVSAATLALARTAMGLGTAAAENIGTVIVDDGAGHLTIGANEVTPLMEVGAFTNIASAATTDLGSTVSNNINITGTNTITSFGSSAATTAPLYFLTFAGVLSLAYNATVMQIPGGTSLMTSAGSSALVEYLGGGNWRILAYFPATGTAIWPRGTLYGLTLSSPSTTTIGVAAGGAANENASVTCNMVLASAFTKSTSSWAVGTTHGGLFNGTIATDTWYHVYLIQNASNGSIDVGFETNYPPTHLPTGYTNYRRLGSFQTDGSSHVTPFFQIGDEFLWTVPSLDVNLTNPATGPVSVTLSVPLGVRVKARLRAALRTITGTIPTLSLYSPDITDQTPQGNTAATAALVLGVITPAASTTNWGTGMADVFTNTASQIRYSLSSSITGNILAIETDGWIDNRGRV